MSGHDYGFVGLGSMGMPMAARIHESGHSLFVFDERDDAVARAGARGLRVAASLEALVARCRVVAVCVYSDSDVEAVVGDLLDRVSSETKLKTIVVHSTVRPSTIRELEADCRAAGVQVIDAPVSGDMVAREAGTLTMMVGGPVDAVAECRSLFSASAANVFVAGQAGAGEALKLANNIMAMVGLQACLEALAVGRQFGVDPETIRAVAEVSTGDCFAVRNLEFFGRLLAEHTLAGSDEVFDVLAKDLTTARQVGQELGLDLKVTSAAADVAAANGKEFWT